MLRGGSCSTGVENVLRPLLISGRARISALAVFIGRARRHSGLRRIGIIVGPVVLSLVLALIEFAEEGPAICRDIAHRRLMPRGRAAVQSAPLWTYLIYSTV